MRPDVDRDHPQSCPFGPAVGLDLHPAYRQVRQQQPVCRVTLPYGEPAWLLTRYADVRAVLGDPQFSRAMAGARDQPRMVAGVFPMGPLDMDPPEHSRIRRLLAKAFTMRAAERLRPFVLGLATELITAMVDAGPPADLVRDFAQPLQITVICELFGVPRLDRAGFIGWIDDTTSGAVSEEVRAEGLRRQLEYLTDLVARRRRAPTEDDLLGALVLARDAADRLSEDELLVLAMVLLGAGFETTANEIANFVFLLLTHPDQLALVRARPDLIPGAVEELLRFTPLVTNPTTARYATRDVTIGGQEIAAGDAILAYTTAANRDDAVYPDPDRLDVTRTPAAAHLAFGHGGHYCVGAQLARMELQVVLGELIDRLPGLRLAVDPDAIEWKRSVLVRGPIALPIAW